MYPSLINKFSWRLVNPSLYFQVQYPRIFSFKFRNRIKFNSKRVIQLVAGINRKAIKQFEDAVEYIESSSPAGAVNFKLRILNKIDEE